MPERFTPGPWNVEKPNRYMVTAPAKSNAIVAAVTKPVDAQLIAQAPALYTLVKEYLKAHSFPYECTCFECVAARHIVAQIESEEE